MFSLSLAAVRDRSFDGALRSARDLQLVAEGTLDDGAKGWEFVNNDGQGVEQVLGLDVFDLGVSGEVVGALLKFLSSDFHDIVVSLVKLILGSLNLLHLGRDVLLESFLFNLGSFVLLLMSLRLVSDLH